VIYLKHVERSAQQQRREVEETTRYTTSTPLCATSTIHLIKTGPCLGFRADGITKISAQFYAAIKFQHLMRLKASVNI